MALCLACSGHDHEKEDCPYRDEARRMRASGIDVTARDLRRMDEAARR